MKPQYAVAAPVDGDASKLLDDQTLQRAIRSDNLPKVHRVSVLKDALQSHLPNLGEYLARPRLIVARHHDLVATKLCWLLLLTHGQLAGDVGDKLLPTVADSAEADRAAAIEADKG